MMKSLYVLLLTVCFVQVFTFPVDDYSVVVLNSFNQPYEGIVSNGYKFGYELSDGQSRNEAGSFVQSNNDVLALHVDGSYAFNAPEGESFVVTYIANENGFQPRVSRVRTKTIKPTTEDYDKFGAGNIDLRFGKNED